MGRRFALLALAGALALVVASGVGAVVTNGDPAGDSGGAPDVSATSVDNDTSGTLTFTITDNQATLAPDALLLLGINSDNSTATGPGGIDYLFSLDSGGYDFAMWSSSANTFVDAPHTTAHVFYGNGVARLVINKSELGNTTVLTYLVLSLQIDSAGNAVAQDMAPDAGGFFPAYTLTVPAPAPAPTPAPTPAPVVVAKVTLGATASKTGAHAGKAFSVSAPVAATKSGIKVTCAAKVGTKVVHLRGSYSRGNAVCSGTLPAGTSGKRVTGTITATIAGAKATKTFGFAVHA